MRAKLADAGLTLKRSAQGFLGSPAYMAPELLRGDAVPATASDVYAFGIILCECFSRQPPYAGEPMVSALAKVADPSLWPPHRPTCPPGSVPLPWEDLIKQCLHPSPEARPTFAAITAQMRDGRSLADALQGAGATGTGSVSGGVRSGPGGSGHQQQQQQLAQMPPHVAVALREGREVKPEAYAEVTACFCTVARFPALLRELDGAQARSSLWLFLFEGWRRSFFHVFWPVHEPAPQGRLC